MVEISYLLKNGSGFVFQALITDFVAFMILGYISITTVYPFVKNVFELKKIAKKVGGPKPHWFWGDIKKYGFNHKGLENSVKRCEEFPAMCTFHLGLRPTYYLYHPDVNKTILTCTISKAWVYKKVLSTVMGDGLVTSDGGLWRRHRRLLTTIFHFDILKEHCMVFNKNLKDTLKTFDEFAGSENSHDVVPTLSTLAYVNMMESVMSQTAVDEHGRASIFIPALKELNQLLLERQQNPFHWSETIYKLSQKGKRLFEEKEKIFKESIRIIKERQALLDSMKDTGDTDGKNIIKDSNGKVFTFKKRKGKIMDFLDLLIQTKDEHGVGLSNDEIADEVVTFFLAGMETTATTMTWIIYLLSTHPEYQDRCRSELDNVLGDKENIEMSDLNKLPYLNQCTKEALRIFPPLHVVARSLEEDTTFSHRFNDYEKIVLKKGTNVILNIFATHRNPSVWENPEVYDPERFNEKNISKIPNFAYIPFAAGPRNCIGQHLGLAEVKVSIAQLLRRYKFSWDPKIPYPKMKVGVTLQPDGPIPLNIKSI